ncbi:hypothetical protein PRZ48_013659 [Zasmidium cellare]|uniref:BZIP domain-containing protein n=1 Tax=Zasmidium cellare TaxID=395010 RepID=A0ABR0E2G5_ZASCE|nr:hypothetical protein PRZ48_013659 [Zasmidium cellare]
MDPQRMQFNPWYRPLDLLPMPDYTQQQFFGNGSPSPSTTSSSPTLSSREREETINSLHEARKQKRREQNKAAQRKFRLRKEQTETQLRSNLVDAEKHLEDLSKDNSRLLQELCSVRKENLVWRARQAGGGVGGEGEGEMRELEAMERRLSGVEGRR